MMNSRNFSNLAKYTPGGSQTLSKMANRYPSNYPKVLEYGTGGKVYDEDGKGYIDLIAGLGAVSIGYSNEVINDEVVSQLNKGVTFSLPTALEWQLAEMLTQCVPWTNQWRFGKTGTDGVLMAVRAARAYTGRKKILTFGYHGCTDHFECLGTRQAGMLDLSEYIHKLDIDKPYPESNDYAAVVLEPWILKPQYTQGLRNWCDRTGTLLIADEVVTGGRWEGFTASQYIGVKPDLIVMGKGLANGFPICAVGGNRDIMKTFERNDFFASGTFGGEAVSMAAALATIPILNDEINKRVTNGTLLQKSFNSLFYGIGKCVGYPTRLDFQFATQRDRYKFWQEMCKQGILMGYNNFIMVDHTSTDVSKILEAMMYAAEVFNKIDLEGMLPSEAVNRG